MKTLEMDYKAADGKDYFEVVIDLKTKSSFMVKNGSCTASIYERLSEKTGLEYHEVRDRFNTYFNLNSAEPILERVPKKYHSFLTTGTAFNLI